MTKEQQLFSIDAINEDPLGRVSPAIRSLLKNPEHAIDVHTHLFTEDYLTGFSGLIKAYGLLNSPIKMERLFRILKQKSMGDVADIYQKEYALMKGKTIMTALMIDFEFAFPGNKEQCYLEQLDELNRMGRKGQVLPFLGLDPRRLEVEGSANLWNLFFRAFGEKGAFSGVKVFPCLGFLPSDPELMKLFEICEAKSIPVTTHCGGPEFRPLWGKTRVSGTVAVPHRLFSPQRNILKTWTDHNLCGFSSRKADYLNEPRQWLPVMRSFPNLKLNLGHLGGINHWKKHFQNKRDRRLEDIHLLMEEFPHVYGDISGFPFNPREYRSFLTDTRFALLRERALFGSDYWIILSADGFLESTLFYKLVTSKELRKRFEQDNPQKFLFARTGFTPVKVLEEQELELETIGI